MITVKNDLKRIGSGVVGRAHSSAIIFNDP